MRGTATAGTGVLRSADRPSRGAGAVRVLARVAPAPIDPTAPAPRVTVVVPCFDYAGYLPVAVRSALAQTGVRVDVVVVDDASTDDSLAVARALAADDDRVTVLAHSTNQGPVATFNDGLARVTGDYLVRLDADDALTPGSLARAVALAERFPSVGMVYGRPVHFSGPVLPPARTDVRSWVVWSGASWLEHRCRRGVNCITSPEVLMRTSVVRDVGGQRDLAHAHDMEMWLRLARAADVARLDGPDQAWHREHEASLSAREVDGLTDLHERALAFATLFGDGRGDPVESQRLHGLARRALAREALLGACQGYVRGWADDASTRPLLDFAHAMVDDVDDLPEAARLRASRRAGARRARYVPRLVAPAVLTLVDRRLRARAWQRTGL
ncbi:Glycosyl transferase family 2 [Geodermatophilus obscurus]|uniref:Glycosyl transferase family 2 n=1 Tax=Geodermatophilus obscurus TaxID=1861 RepID=A0A1I5DJA4_9ACTN|nr:Glycosyl transferase family 2 [Geodermatophilus obscurus]